MTTLTRILLILAAIVIFLLVWERCEGEPTTSTREAELTALIKHQDSIIANMQTKRDTIKIEIDRWYVRIDTVHAEREAELAPIPDYQLTDSYDWITNKYGFEGIELQPSKVAIANDPLKTIITDVVRGKYAENELVLTKGLVTSLEDDILLADNIISQHEASRIASDQIIKIKSEEVSKERRAKNFWKVATPVALIGGVILGTQIK